MIALFLLKDKRIASCSTNGEITIYSTSLYYNKELTTNIKHQTIRNQFQLLIKWWKYLNLIYNANDDIIYKIIVLPNNRIESCSRDKKNKI